MAFTLKHAFVSTATEGADSSKVRTSNWNEAHKLYNGATEVSLDNVVNGAAKAWVNFNGTGTVAIRASFNVSSITDNGTGNYTVNFTTPLPDANYSAVANRSNEVVNNNFGTSVHTFSTSGFNLLTVENGTAYDSYNMSAAVFR